jgi:hypothetical protein
MLHIDIPLKREYSEAGFTDHKGVDLMSKAFVLFAVLGVVLAVVCHTL